MKTRFRARASSRSVGRTFGVLITLVVFAGASRGLAQEKSQPGPGQDLEVEPVEAEVQAAAKVEEEITVSSPAAQSETGAVTVLDRDEIERAEARDAGELVRTVAGVHLLTSGSRGGTSHAFIRGGDANFTLILLDGIPLNDATDVQGGAFNLSTLGVDDVASVEVLRGPHSAFFGSSAVAGAINLVTRDGRAGPDGRLRLDAGESELRRAGISLADRLGARGATETSAARAATDSAPGANPGGGNDSEEGDSPGASTDSDFRRGADVQSAFAGDFFLGARYDEERHAMAEDSYRQVALHGAAGLDLGPGTGLRLTGRLTDLAAKDYPEGSGGPLFGSGELRQTDGRELSLGLHWSLAAGDWGHGGQASVNRADHDVDSPAIEPLVPSSVEDRSYSRAQLAWTASRDLSRRVGLSLGAQLDREDGETTSTLFLPPFLGGATSGDYQLDRATPGVFAAATVDVGELVIEAGARADDPEGLPVEWSPRLGLRWRIANSGWQARSSWSRAFKLPSFFALASPPALGGNPALLPETSEGIDVGVEYQRGSNRFGLTLFRSTYEDLIDFDFERFMNVNRSRIEAQGVELVGLWQPSAAVRVTISWTLQDIDDASLANVVLHSPEGFAYVGLDWNPLDPLRLRLGARSVDDTRDVQIPVPDRTRVEGYRVVDVAASWQVAQRWLVRGSVDNLTDREYEHFIGFPQPGRKARVGLQYDFR